ncbi:Helix-turn-helix domain-containing DNA-binding protein (plasmid) [Candidatus Megaera polyxenophila]|nr:Helix-turn-helix domain-containing DNA-binding protein [Candidatus Megaera polyxenophila]
MSSKLLRENITRILQERGWKLQDLERKAGTNRNIYNIFSGKSTNPSVDLLQKIAKTLNVDYKELIEDAKNIHYVNNYKLLLEACQKVIEEIQLLPENIKISYEAIFILILEVYSYAEQFNNTSIDNQFVKWSIMKYYSLDSLDT